MNVCGIANRLWRAANVPYWRRFRRALLDPAAVQRKLLSRYIQRSRTTRFATDHRLGDSDDLQTFRKKVPIRSYDQLTDYMDLIRAGEQNVLTHQAVRRLTPSSGSTKACKLIPYTSELLREFNRAIGPWVVELFRQDPQIMNGSAYWAVSPAIPPPAIEAAVPIGFEDDSAYVGRWASRLVDATLAVPADVRHILDHDAWLDATIDHLLAEQELRLISVWHPSYLALLLDAIEVRQGITDWSQTWPKLRIVSCWTDAGAAAPAQRLAERLPGVAVQPKGLLATECVVSLPFEHQRPAAICSHFFEFLDDRDQPHLLHELQADHEYRVVVTTGGGLWRYCLGDRVRVDGYLAGTPSLTFVGRADRVSDLCGEKLSDAFVAAALRQLAADWDWRGAAMLLPGEDASPPAYYLLIDGRDAPGVEPLLGHLESLLRRNPHYDHCRRLGQIGPVRPVVSKFEGDVHEFYLRVAHADGRRLGDIKPPALLDRTRARKLLDAIGLGPAEQT